MKSFAALAGSLLVAASTGLAAARDLAALMPDEIQRLQQRLTDATCYSGPVDGRVSPALETAKRACPDQEPVLRIETGMHTAPIRRIAADAACSVLATASYDKTVRLWSLPDGRLKQTIRLPVGGVEGGKVYAVALSGDGRWLAAGGWDATWDSQRTMGLYLTDLASGATRRIGTFESVVNHIAFLPDGRRVAVALGQGKGIRVHDIATGSELMADRDYGGDSYGIAVTADGGMVATGMDGFLRRYGPDLKRSAKAKAPDGARPFAVAVSPDGRRLGVGYDDTTAVSILDALTLRPLAKADTGDLTNGDLSKVAWSRDNRLWAGGRANPSGGDRKILRPFTAEGRKAGADVGIAANTVSDLKPCGGDIAFGAADPSFGLVAASGKVTELIGPVTADMRGKRGDAFAVSSDGVTVRFGLGVSANDAVLFDLAAGRLVEAATLPAGLDAPTITGLDVTNWQDKTNPAFKGKPIALKQFETSQSLAIRPGRAGFVLGTTWSLRAIEASGTERWRKDVPATTWGVNLARNGNLILAAHSDGTVRWYRWSDGEELLALFVHRLDRRWVAWTPTGYYMASPGGEDLIGWHVNRGWEQAPDFFPASRFRDRFSRPDIVQKVLVTLDEVEAVRQANAESKRKDVAPPIEALLPPVITILPPAGGAVFSGDSITLDYDVRSPSGLTVDGIDVLIDGRPATEARGLSRIDPAKAGDNACLAAASRGLKRVDGRACRLTVPLPARDVELALIARAGTISSEPARLALTYQAAKIGAQTVAPADELKPKLYVLAVGVADYADPALKLGLAAKDAADFAAAMRSQQGGLYRAVEIRLLADRDATHDSVLEGLDWLEKQVTSRDIGMVFLAGHGVMDERNRFYYLPSDANVEKLKTRAVSKDAIMDALTGLAGKAILFLDSCHAAGVAGAGVATRGSVDVNGFVNELASSENGVVVFGSSTGRELSQESAEWGNGAFTKAVIEGIAEGKADLLGKGTVTLSSLDAYVAERVKELTGGRQHPVMAKPATITNFPLALVRR